MDIYFYLPVLILVFHFFSLIIGEGLRRILFVILSIIFFVVAGFREMGFDYEHYSFLSDIYSNKDWFKQSLYYNTEVGYAYVNNIIPDFKAVVAIITFIIVITQFSFIYKNTKYPFLAMFFYFGIMFYTSLMGQYRQAFSIGFMLLAITNIKDKKKFLFLIAIAFTFHYTALITIILLWIPQKLFKYKTYLIALCISILIGLVLPKLFSGLSSYSSYLDAKTSYYENADYKEITGINTVMIIRFGLFSLCFYFREKLAKIPKMEFYMNIYFTSLLIYIAFSFLTALASRGSMYFAFFEIILASNLIYVFRKNILVQVALLSVFVALSIIRQMNSHTEKNFDECFNPYKNWLFKEL
jgi:hypothetical protein